MDDYADLVGRCQIVAYVEVASAAALLFDFCITFDSEVRWIWGRKWGIMRIAFIISRYLPVGTIAMYLFYGVESTRGGIPNSGMYIAIIGTMNALGAVAADGQYQLQVKSLSTRNIFSVMLIARTHAFYGREKNILIAMSFFSTVMIAATLIILYVVASKCGEPTCDAPMGQGFLSIIYALHIMYHLGLMSLTVYKRFKFYRQENTPLVSTVYWDGVIYMLCTALASMVNCVGIIELPSPYSSLFYCPQVVVRSVFASRILFNLQETNDDSHDVFITRSNASRVVIAGPIQTSSCVDRLELLDITDG
ncbi:hypothetical protein EV702DRAFT_618503 [Suillus placidus]|uniref:DUF6533 domain-containing protein n=1 Tax=Suillus placidus TaxID=48579 RepID=A0A9P6ZNJ4_9AGAM|nr:hypothetical protein EV702DRAFT_618503 [Suillus placidus]